MFRINYFIQGKQLFAWWEMRRLQKQDRKETAGESDDWYFE